MLVSIMLEPSSQLTVTAQGLGDFVFGAINIVANKFVYTMKNYVVAIY